MIEFSQTPIYQPQLKTDERNADWEKEIISLWSAALSQSLCRLREAAQMRTDTAQTATRLWKTNAHKISPGQANGRILETRGNHQN